MAGRSIWEQLTGQEPVEVENSSFPFKEQLWKICWKRLEQNRRQTPSARSTSFS